MTLKEQQRNWRSDLFRHLDGLVMAPVAYALHKKGITKFLLQQGSCSIGVLSQKFEANEGYLNVALRLMCSQGWLNQKMLPKKNEVNYYCNDLSEKAFSFLGMYEEAVDLLQFSGGFHPRRFETQPFNKLELLFENYRKSESLINKKNEIVQNQILKHIEGYIIGPSAVHLGMSGIFHKYFMEARFSADEFHTDGINFGRLLDIFTYLEWFSKESLTYRFTQKGLFFAKRASAYGVTVSYLPTFRLMDELLFGNPKIAKGRLEDGNETGVDRAMNVWGSGGAHNTYFKVIDKMITTIFNKPLEMQPKGILDMGCGNGAFISHLYHVIEKQTLRGEHLDTHPLFLVGADFNEAALKITRKNLVGAGIWAKVIKGDVGRPDLLAADLKKNYEMELTDLLNVRSFLDHNRIWMAPKEKTSLSSKSTGAFAFEGQRLSNGEVQRSLTQHLGKWKPWVAKHGLLIIELHTLPPEITAQNIGSTPATAYDATHGFSDQFIVEIQTFEAAVSDAGLKINKEHAKRFPNSELATVSINLLEVS